VAAREPDSIAGLPHPSCRPPGPRGCLKPDICTLRLQEAASQRQYVNSGHPNQTTMSSNTNPRVRQATGISSRAPARAARPALSTASRKSAPRPTSCRKAPRRSRRTAAPTTSSTRSSLKRSRTRAGSRSTRWSGARTVRTPRSAGAEGRHGVLQDAETPVRFPPPPPFDSRRSLLDRIGSRRFVSPHLPDAELPRCPEQGAARWRLGLAGSDKVIAVLGGWSDLHRSAQALAQGKANWYARLTVLQSQTTGPGSGIRAASSRAVSTKRASCRARR